MTFNKIPRTPVGADLSRTPPIDRPSLAVPVSGLLRFLQVNRTRIGLQGHRRAGITANITMSSTARNILFLHIRLGKIAVDRARIGGCIHVEG